MVTYVAFIQQPTMSTKACDSETPKAAGSAQRRRKRPLADVSSSAMAPQAIRETTLSLNFNADNFKLFEERVCSHYRHLFCVIGHTHRLCKHYVKSSAVKGIRSLVDLIAVATGSFTD